MELDIPFNDYFLVKPSSSEPPYLSKNSTSAVLYLHDHENLPAFISTQDVLMYSQKGFPDIPMIIYNSQELSLCLKKEDSILEAYTSRIDSTKRNI